MKSKFSAILASAAIALVLSQAACTPNKSASEIAQEITVLIDGCSPGSGILLEKQGNTYSVLTAGHVVSNDLDCLVITPDGQRHPAEAKKFQRYDGLDLAVVQFESANTYNLSNLEKSEAAKINKKIYVAGAPEPNETIPKRALRVTDGIIISTPPEGTLGYTLVYNNTTRRGMSGGPVLDEQGKVIGIHGRGDQADGSKENYGIPIQKFLTAKVSKSDVDKYLSQGIALFEKGDYQAAIAAYNKAIEINPNNADAYFNRGNAHYKLGYKQESIADYNRVIQINPNDAVAYNNRGNIRNQLGDKQAAIADYDQAIKINPNYAETYYNRGLARHELGDKQAAIADFDQAIKINPNLAPAYSSRGIARYELGEKQAAIADYDQFIKINPNYADAYYFRGNARSDLGEKQAAISDYDQAIKINPNYAEAYYNRGNARSKLGDKQRAISDFRKAADLYPQQGKQSYYQDALKRVKELE